MLIFNNFPKLVTTLKAEIILNIFSVKDIQESINDMDIILRQLKRGVGYFSITLLKSSHLS